MQPSMTAIPPAEQEITAAKEAAFRDPQNWRAFNNLGLVYYRQAQYDRAVSAFQQALALYSVTSILEAEKRQTDAQTAQRAALEAKREADLQRAKALQSQQEMNDLFNMVSGIAAMKGNTSAQMLVSTMQTVNNQLDTVPNTVPPLSPEMKAESSLKSKREVSGIYVCLGSAYFGKRDYLQAVASFENAMQLDPSRTDVLKTSAEAYYFLCKYDDCIRTFARYHAIAPVEQASLLRLSDAYRALGMQAESDKAFTAFVDREDRTPGDCMRLLRTGATCLSHWRYDQALAYLSLSKARAAADANPDTARVFADEQARVYKTPQAVLLMLAEAHFNLRQTSEASALLRDAVAQDGTNAKAWYMLAQCYDETGEADKAAAAYRKALDCGRGKDPSADFIQVCRAATGEGDEAIRVLETRLGNVPLTPGGGANQWCALAFAFEKAGRIQEAMEIFNRCNEASPVYTRARLALERLGKQTAAERQRDIEDSGALTKSGEPAQALAKLAEAYRLTPAGAEKENVRKSLLRLAAGMETQPALTGSAQDHYLKGVVALKAAKSPMDLGQALAQFQWAIFYAPWAGELYFNTSAVKKLQNQTAAAVNDLKLYLAAKPGAANMSDMLNRLYEFDFQREQNLRELAGIAAF